MVAECPSCDVIGHCSLEGEPFSFKRNPNVNVHRLKCDSCGHRFLYRASAITPSGIYSTFFATMSPKEALDWLVRTSPRRF